MTTLLVRPHVHPEVVAEPAATPLTRLDDQGWCQRCYRTRRGRAKYTPALHCRVHTQPATAFTVDSAPTTRPNAALVRAKAIMRARAERAAPATTSRSRPQPGSATRRAQGRARARERAVHARTLRPDGTFRLPRTWRQRLGGLRQPVDQPAALALFAAYAELTDRRVDRRERELLAFRVLVVRADWHTMTTCATRDRLAAAAGVCVDTISTYLRSWRAAGLIRVVLHPLSPARALGRAEHDGVGRAPIYALTYTAELAAASAWWTSHDDDTTDDLPLSPVDNLDNLGNTIDSDPCGVESPQVSPVVDTSAEATHLGVSSSSMVSAIPFVRAGNSDISNQQWGRRHIPVIAKDRRRASRQIAQDAGWQRQVRLADLDAVLTPWWATGWCIAALMWALDHDPDGTARINTDRVRHPVGWMRWRLRAWCDQAGLPLTPPIQGIVRVVTSDAPTGPADVNQFGGVDQGDNRTGYVNSTAHML